MIPPLILPLALACLTAQDSAAPELDASTREAVADRIGEILETSYVFPEKAAECREHLEGTLAEGAFAEIQDHKAFAEALTAELQGVTGDKHLVVYARPPADPNEEPVEVEREDPRVERARQRDRARRENFGFARVEILEGNVGYVDMRSFAPPMFGWDTAVGAMAFVANCDALIFDMRKNGGGSPGMVQLVCSYLFGEPTHLNSLYFREEDHTQEFWTFPEVPGTSMHDVPVYVLTSSYTFSGAEEFTYNLQTRERATVVGETTGGGAHPGRHVEIAGRFGMFVPTGRAINPITGINWEGTGVVPDIAVAADDALERALAEARPAAEAFAAARLEHRLAQARLVAGGLETAREQLAAGEVAAASATLDATVRGGLDADVLDEQEVNMLGYEFLGEGRTGAAVAVLRVNTDTFPGSANTWDSLGEAYAEDGQVGPAIESYRRSLELDPRNENARRRIEALGGSD